MSRHRASLILDPLRRPEQLAFIREREPSAVESGEQVWAVITDDQATTFSERGILVQFHDDEDFVELPAVRFRPPEDVPDPPPDLTRAPPTGDASTYYIVQLAAPDAAFLDDIVALGAEIIDDLPGPSALFKMTAAQAAACQELPGVAWVGLYHPAYALDFGAAGRSEPFSSADLPNLLAETPPLEPDPSGNLRLVFFSDVATTDARGAVEAAGAVVVADIGGALVVNAPASALRALLRVPGLRALERHAELTEAAHHATVIMGANQVRNFRTIDFLVNLDGTGETVHVYDGGFDNGAGFPVHPDLVGRIVIANANGAALPTADFSAHGTHVAASVAGDGANAAGVLSPNVPRGVAPSANILFSSCNTGLPPAPGQISPRNFAANLFPTFAQASQNGARVHNNSIGNDNNNQYSTTLSERLDRFCFLNPDDTVVVAAGNAERQTSGAGILGLNHLGELAVAKNVLTVGASENVSNDGTANYAQFGAALFTSPTLAPNNAAVAAPALQVSDNANQIALFSARGRVQHGTAARRRVRPDLVAPGTNVISARRVVLAPPPLPPIAGRVIPGAVAAPAAFYGVLSGTSQATPLVSGSCALVRQYYRSLFGQLRRPTLVDALTAFVDTPAVAPHRDGHVIAWPRPNGANQDIATARFTTSIERVGAVTVSQATVGAAPAVTVARHGDNTVLLHRGADRRLRLSLFDRNLAPVTAFGALGPTPGTVTLAEPARIEDDRRPAMCIRDNEVAVVWIEDGTDNLRFHRFRLDTGGGVDPVSVVVGNATNTSPHPYVLHNGARYALVWARLDAGVHGIFMRFVDNSGALSGIVTLVTQPAVLRSPHVSWNPRASRFRVVWVSEDVHAGGDVMSMRFGSDGAATAQPARRIVALAATEQARAPWIALHPTTGYAVLWEDDSQPAPAAALDVYLMFLAQDGVPDARIPGNRLRISDAPQPTRGFSGFLDGSGLVVCWLGNDEINSDINAVFAVKITLEGAFRAQLDPNAPLVDSGRYVSQTLIEHSVQAQTSVAATWAGGQYLQLGLEFEGFGIRTWLIRSNADGLPDAAFGAGGRRQVDLAITCNGLALLWAGARVLAALHVDASIRLLLFDAVGNAEATFGANGVRDVLEAPSALVNPSLGARGTGTGFRFIAAWGRHDAVNPAQPMLRCAEFDRLGAVVTAARDLTTCNGTALQGWFHFVPSDTPARVIVVWHEIVGGVMAVRLNRFNLASPVATMAQHAPALTLAALPGPSQNAVVAPRPVLFDPPVPANAAQQAQTRQREYGLAFQNQPPAGNWQVLFSRLGRDGSLGATVNVAVASSPTDHCTDPQLVWHTNGYGLAWLQQLTAGGPRRLMFNVMDQNGANLGPAPAQVTSATADVQRYHLIWNGRSFRASWTETDGTVIRHRHAALAVPRGAAPAGFDRPYQHPSSALVRATLINGATNIRQTALPNVPSTAAATFNPNDGYGWGRVNLRQSLAPAPPVTFYVRDDTAIASNQIVRYQARLPPGTNLLRVTLAWTDPPGNAVVNALHLRVTAPPVAPNPAQVFVGNRFAPGGPPAAQFSAPLPVVPPANPFQITHTVEQVVITNPPAGTYLVEIVALTFTPNIFQTHPGQPFALVFVGSGVEWPLVAPPAAIGAALPFF